VGLEAAGDLLPILNCGGLAVAVGAAVPDAGGVLHRGLAAEASRGAVDGEVESADLAGLDRVEGVGVDVGGAVDSVDVRDDPALDLEDAEAGAGVADRGGVAGGLDMLKGGDEAVDVQGLGGGAGGASADCQEQDEDGDEGADERAEGADGADPARGDALLGEELLELGGLDVGGLVGGVGWVCLSVGGWGKVQKSRRVAMSSD